MIEFSLKAGKVRLYLKAQEPFDPKAVIRLLILSSQILYRNYL